MRSGVLTVLAGTTGVASAQSAEGRASGSLRYQSPPERGGEHDGWDRRLCQPHDAGTGARYGGIPDPQAPPPQSAPSRPSSAVFEDDGVSTYRVPHWVTSISPSCHSTARVRAHNTRSWRGTDVRLNAPTALSERKAGRCFRATHG